MQLADRVCEDIVVTGIVLAPFVSYLDPTSRSVLLLTPAMVRIFRGDATWQEKSIIATVAVTSLVGLSQIIPIPQ